MHMRVRVFLPEKGDAAGYCRNGQRAGYFLYHNPKSFPCAPEVRPRQYANASSPFGVLFRFVSFGCVPAARFQYAPRASAAVFTHVRAIFRHPCGYLASISIAM